LRLGRVPAVDVAGSRPHGHLCARLDGQLHRRGGRRRVRGRVAVLEARRFEDGRAIFATVAPRRPDRRRAGRNRRILK
jgi:hypothetical protein